MSAVAVKERKRTRTRLEQSGVILPKKPRIIKPKSVIIEERAYLNSIRFSPVRTGGVASGAIMAARRRAGGGSPTPPPAPGPLTFIGQTSWARPSPATPAEAQALGWRLRPFTDKAGMDALIGSSGTIANHDYVYYNGTSKLVIAGGSSTADNYLLKSKNLSDRAVVDFGTAKSIWNPAIQTNGYVEFNYNVSGGGLYNSFRIWNCSNLDVYGGSYTGTAGGFSMYGANNNVNFIDPWAHDIGGACGVSPVSGNNITNCLIRGEVGPNWAMLPSHDSHTDKGTGIHCLISENSGGSGDLIGNTWCIFGHDSLQPGATSYGQVWPEGAGGCVIEFGNDGNPGGQQLNNMAYAFGQHNSMRPGDGTNPGSTGVQSGGNVFNLYGQHTLDGLIIGWAEGNNIMGAVIHGNNTNWLTGSPGIIVRHGRNHLTNQYGTNGGSVSPSNAYYQDARINYQDNAAY